MSKIVYIFSICCLFLFFTACGYKEGVVQSSSNSYLEFTGNTHNAIVTIDNGDPFPLKETDDNRDIIHYQVSPGKHKIVIKRKNIIVLNREILIGKGMTKEISVK